MIPTPENYDAYVEIRRAATQREIDRAEPVTGEHVKALNLSIKQFEDAGYTFNAESDTLFPPV